MKGINPKNIDFAVNPADDFYDYATGGWRLRNPLKGTYSRYGTFDALREKGRKRLKKLVTDLAVDPFSHEPQSAAWKVGHLYAMGMDKDRLNREKAQPILPIIEKIKNIPSGNLTELLGVSHQIEGGNFFGTGVGPNPADSDMNIMYIGEMGLGLGDRDYYLEDTDENIKIRNAYQKYVKRIMTLVGYTPSEAQRVWEAVIEIETQAARNEMTREERRNPQLRYNMHTIEELRSKYSAIDWDGYFRALDVPVPECANVSSPAYMDFLQKWIPSLEWQKIVDYTVFDIVSGGSGLLSDEFRNANFEMFGRVMSGRKRQKPRWERALAIPNSMLGEEVGKLYVERYFPEQSKSAMLNLVENLRKALSIHISSLTWMSDATKEKALEKLSTMKVKIGYPDKFKDYSEIEIDPNRSYFENVLEASKWYIRDNYKKLGKPVDKQEWHMTPQTVNAYYSPLNNEICFPAAILQPPYFNLKAAGALNYGAIGVVIGHEMTHAFDDQGRQFDASGNLNGWWTPDDEHHFNSLAYRLVEQFNAVEVLDGKFANGRYTLGENIADQGGLRIALTAYKESLKGNDSSESKVPKKDDLRNFYLSYAGLWAENIRDEEILLRTKEDPHSLGRWRVNQTLKNIHEFYEAFDVDKDAGMYLDESQRVIIW